MEIFIDPGWPLLCNGEILLRPSEPIDNIFQYSTKKKGGIQTREVNNKKAVTSFFTIYTLHRCPKCVDFCNVLIAHLLRGIVIL